ncbi:MAG TPA: tRNA (guanosine(37)-N1)-methyltransferase TrmD [Phycisphaerae bacterium]|nr:tRNA (guanosine(37)-N1)-methyltransferase TrmD [Phycisphaerae bacterium]
MRIDVLTLFPEVCEPFFAASILGRARNAGLVTIQCHNIRDYASGRHQTVDDRPFGGGAGMVMMCQPVFDAVEAIEKLEEGESTLILLTPQGERLNQGIVEDLAARRRLIVIAGHYEGFDERICLGLSPREISIGDYVLSGGEAAAMVLVDAVVRLIPGALGNPEAASGDSFSISSPRAPEVEGPDDAMDHAAYLEYPQYTRPRVFRGMEVPEILLSGDHAKIRAWRKEQARLRTAQRRPDLLPKKP